MWKGKLSAAQRAHRRSSPHRTPPSVSCAAGEIGCD
jgi:hypothetical protein